MVEGCRKKYKNFGRDGKSDFLYATVTKLRSLYERSASDTPTVKVKAIIPGMCAVCI
jgi:hypothetical protein